MSADVVLPLVLTIVYLGGLALASELVERSPRFAERARSPLVFGLALGVYATTWTFYGSVGFAESHGYNFLAISLGVVLSCLAIPAVWLPLSRVIRRERLTSVADLLAFRYQSHTVGVVVTVYLVAGLLPYVSLQLRAISDAARHIAGPDAPPFLSSVYAGLLSVFAAVLGARYAEARRQRPGLLAALAIETILKSSAILVVGGVALFLVFGGVGGLSEHLAAHPELVHDLAAPAREAPWSALLFASFVAAFLLPRQFHVAFVEQPSDRALRQVAWVLPLVLLALNLPLPILYWAGRVVAPPGTAPDLYVIAAVQQSRAATMLSFLGGVSAASAMVLMSSIALSSMVTTHLVIPVLTRGTQLYAGLTLLRQVVIVAIVAAGFAVQALLPSEGSLVDIGLVSFTAVVQLVPGIVGVLWWRRASRAGLLLGLGAGVVTAALVVVLDRLGVELVGELLASLGFAPGDPRSPAIWGTLLVNATFFVVGSLIWPPRASERDAAAASLHRSRGRIGPIAVSPLSIEALRGLLTRALGERGAAEELGRALDDEGLAPDEERPAPLRRLLERLEGNLSELVGPLVARVILGRGMASPPSEAAVAAQLSFLERTSLLPGEAPAPAELVRRYLLGVLEEMPVGLCAIDGTGAIVVWNQHLASSSGIPQHEAVGVRPEELPGPWNALLAEAYSAPEGEPMERTLTRLGTPQILRFRHRVLGGNAGGHAALVEDLTERRALLAQVAHQDRLASVGRVAAGVAHEIGNPLTGLMMVAGNLRGDHDAEDLDERLGLILHEGQRIHSIVQTMLGFSRSEDTGQMLPEEVALADLAEDAVRLARIGASDLRFEVDVPPRLRVQVDRQRITQVLLNLLTNARDASPQGGRVWVQGHEEAGDVVLEVADEGPGIPDALAPRIFEPFFTTKDPGSGTGLGLAISYRIIEAHGGSIGFGRAGARTVFRVRLPGLEAPSSAPAVALPRMP